MTVRLTWLLPGVLVAASVAGCGDAFRSSAEVIGTVRLEGKPLQKALVIFTPADENGPRQQATGVTDESGHYRLSSRGRPGTAAGEYVVTVVESPYPAELQGRDVPADRLATYLGSLGGRPLPPKYADPMTPLLRATVSAESRMFDFDLQRD